MLKVKSKSSEFLALVDEMERLVESGLRNRAELGAPQRERIEEIERQLTRLISLPDRVDERRRGIRLTCRVRVLLRAQDAEREALLLDVGSGGVFVQTPWALPRGEEVQLVVDQDLGTLERGTSLTGVIAWVAAGDVLRPGVGVAFLNTDAVTDRRVRTLVIELLRQESTTL